MTDAEVRLRGRMRGPRIFRGDLATAPRGLTSGELVRVRSHEDRVLGWGLWHPRSRIAVRMLQRSEDPPPGDWAAARARAAIARRRADPSLDLELCRLVHAEGDDLPALTVDRYGDLLSAELYSSSMREHAEEVLQTLATELGTRHWLLRFDPGSARAEHEEGFDLRSPTCPHRLEIREHGVRYEIDLRSGHKTGFFLDQRENRARLQGLCAGKSVLDICCYTGGFALAAFRGGAREVLAVDLDEKALELAKRNRDLNQAHPLRLRHADAFSYLRTLAENGKRFDVVVLDPPKFIPRRRDFDTGIAKYHDLNKLAFSVLADGGLLLSCSCSGLLSLMEFQEKVRQASRADGRPVRIERITGAGSDHPVRIDFPEGSYLKALWLRVG